MVVALPACREAGFRISESPFQRLCFEALHNGAGGAPPHFANCQFRTSYIEQVLRGYFDVKMELALFMDWQTVVVTLQRCGDATKGANFCLVVEGQTPGASARQVGLGFNTECGRVLAARRH